jgi:hypothetical protein
MQRRTKTLTLLFKVVTVDAQTASLFTQADAQPAPHHTSFQVLNVSHNALLAPGATQLIISA